MCWANPLAPQPWHGWCGGAMWRDASTTSASVARILGLWVLFVLGQLRYREDSPNVANGPRLAVEWVGATVSGTSLLADPPDNFFARTWDIIGRDRRMIQHGTAASTLVVVSPPSPGHTTPAARVSPTGIIARRRGKSPTFQVLTNLMRY